MLRTIKGTGKLSNYPKKTVISSSIRSPDKLGNQYLYWLA